MKDSINKLIKRKSLFDEYLLDNERTRIESLVKNKGYYHFSREFIMYEADTNFNTRVVDLKLIIKSLQKIQETQNISQAYKRFRINNVFITNELDFSKTQKTTVPATKKDTASKNGVEFIYPDKFWVNPNTILLQNYLFPGALYSLKDVEATKKHLSALNTYGLINIYFDELPTPDSSEFGYLNCHIRLTPLKLQSYSLTGELTSSSSAFYLGYDAGLTYQHKSLFGNAENLNLKLTGGETWVKNGSTPPESALDLGSTSTINVPKFIFPFYTSPELVRKYNPKTAFTLAYNYSQSPLFYERIANFSYGYNWKIGPYVTHSIVPIEFSWLDVYITNPSFYALVKQTYLINTYTSQYILGSAYSYVFNNQTAQKNKDYHYFKWNLEIAGNTLTLFNDIFKTPKKPNFPFPNYYPLFGKEYSQYCKTDVEYMFDHFIDPNNSVAYHIFAGVGVPYGNSDAMPLLKQYYSGGANSIRGWQPRWLGPGSYQYNDTGPYPNNTGDIKIEANIEYRFKLFWVFEGALFNDAGNIWAITQASTDKRNGILFQGDKFYKDMAIASGAGLRLNVTYFIIRLDFAVKTRDPAKNAGERWIFQDIRPPEKQNIINYQLAIGYPF